MVEDNSIDYSSLNALVIEDQPFVRRINVTLLKQIGFNHIDEAKDGASGLEVCGKKFPDIIICDIEMEPIDGLVFLETLRRSSVSEGKNIPVIFLTQHTNSEIVEKARSLGVDSFLVKPPSFDSLKGKVDYVIRAN